MSRPCPKYISAPLALLITRWHSPSPGMPSDEPCAPCQSAPNRSFIAANALGMAPSSPSSSFRKSTRYVNPLGDTSPRDDALARRLRRMCNEKSRDTAAASARKSSASSGSGERISSTRRTTFFPFAPSTPRNDFQADKTGESTNFTASQTSPQPDVTEYPSAAAAPDARFSSDNLKLFTKDNAAESCVASARATCAPARPASALWQPIARNVSSPCPWINCNENTERSSGSEGEEAMHWPGSI
mmetsp:Transcript_13196/g.55434  ORF Transcript_13196/g.55434 Transcript_13196/m.55434 type:complete len:244 (-) Transcript_13196:1185-1916(-)